MIHQEIRDRFESGFTAPLGQTSTVEALLAAFAEHEGHNAFQYHAISDPLDYTPFDTNLSADIYPDGSLGNALANTPLTVSALFHNSVKGETHETLANLLQHIGHLSEVWRAVLNYPQNPSGDLSLHAFIAQQAPNRASYLALSIWLGRVAFADPEAIKAVYDALACGWQDAVALPNFLTVDWAKLLTKTPAEAREALQIQPFISRPLACPPVPANSLEEASLADQFPELLWALANTPEKALDPYQITAAVAGFGAGFDTPYFEAAQRALLSFEGLCEITSTAIPKTVEIEALKDTPKGSLGQTFYRLITDNNFDVEVLDPASLFGPAQSDMTPSEWMNRRILQLHDVIHLVAGYEQTGEDEVAISGFQLAQLGQAYSAWFIAVTTMIATLYFPAGFAPILHLSLAGWKHGRETKPLVLVDWESLWTEQISTIRQIHSINPFVSRAASLPGLAAD